MKPSKDYRRYSAQIIKGYSKQKEMLTLMAYSHPKTFETFMVKLYQIGIFQSPKFLGILLAEMEKEKASEQLKQKMVH